MLSLISLSRSQVPRLKELKSITATFNKCYGQYLGCRAVVIPTCNQSLLVCFQPRLYSTKAPAPPNPTSGSVSESTIEERRRRKATLRERIQPGHQKIDDEPRITEYMIMEAANKRDGVPMTFEEKVKETGKSMWYGGVMLIGLAALATIAWTVWQELFASDSPNNIYSDSYKLVKSDTQVQDALGYPITCHGEQTRRGWRRHVLHQEFIHNNVKYLRMKYYLKGKFRTATVMLEKKANARGRYDKYTYLIVELDGYPSRQIVVETDDL